MYDPVVFTDYDTRFLQDRRIFYDSLQASCSYLNKKNKSTSHSLLRLLPLARAYYSPPPSSCSTSSEASATMAATDRPEHIEIHGTILFKPVLERSALIPPDAEKEEFRLYYPLSAGGGCKTITYDTSLLLDHKISVVANYNSAVKCIRACDDNFNKDQCYIYEEFNTTTAIEEGTTVEEPQQQQFESLSPRLIPRRYRKRDRLRDLARNVLPETLSGTVIPSYRGDDEITAESDLSRPDRTFWVVTTAALPWMTGTAVNPLLRAAYLTRTHQNVTLVIPWLDSERERDDLYSAAHKFYSREDQEVYIRDWLRKSADMPDAATALKILWYPAFYHKSMMSIFAKTDICSLIQPDNPHLDVVVLEEPEHLNWFKAAGDSWTSKFSFVVGIIHTNYKAYAANTNAIVGPVAATFVSGASTLMVRAYCHKVIKLSAVLQSFAPEKEVVCNVHGVRSDFIKEGRRRAKAIKNYTTETDTTSCSVYFIGKILWAKGLDRLMYLEHFYRKVTGDYFAIDIYGDGPEMPEILRAYHGRSSGRKRRAVSKFIQCFYAFGDSDFIDEEEEEDEDNISKADSEPPAEENKSQPSVSKPWEVRRSISEFELPKSIHEYRLNPIPAIFHGRKDHAQLGQQYKVFVNPSITEVLCTTTAEALAMGKFAVIPHHPSNTFFLQFPNCLAYSNKLEFVANLQWALSHEPEPLTEEQLYTFTWEAASERFIRASGVTIRESRIKAKSQKSKMDERIAFLHNQLGQQGEALRAALTGVSGDSSENLKAVMTPQETNEEKPDESVDTACLDAPMVHRKTKNSLISFSFPVVFLAVLLYYVVNSAVNK
jgi:digalactosyldiacylglycerol synthase